MAVVGVALLVVNAPGSPDTGIAQTTRPVAQPANTSAPATAPTPTPDLIRHAPLPPALASLANLSAPRTATAAAARDTPGAPAEAAAGDSRGEVCGLGTAAPGSPEAAALAAQAAQRDEAAAERLFASMARSPLAAVRAAALFGSDQRDALAREAQHTRDPVVYALAWQACSRTGQKPAGCGALSAHRMAELDPQNVVPWLWVAEEASRAGNGQGVAEAVYRASLATISRLREYDFTALALAALPADGPHWENVFASAQVLQRHAAISLPSYLPVMQHCSAEQTRDANVRETCGRLAQVLVESGDLLVDHAIGRRLGERAGWPAERLQLLEARQAAFRRLGLDGDTLAAGAGHGPCGQLARNIRSALTHSLQGERASMVAALAAAGITDETLLLQHRRRTEEARPR